jgi:hypothetical protein
MPIRDAAAVAKTALPAISRVIYTLYSAFAQGLSSAAEAGDATAALVGARPKTGAVLTSATLVATMLS